jgi:hypothetical protein
MKSEAANWNMSIWPRHPGENARDRQGIARLRTVTPEIMVNYSLPFRDPQRRELYFSGLRLAMGETT